MSAFPDGSETSSPACPVGDRIDAPQTRPLASARIVLEPGVDAPRLHTTHAFDPFKLNEPVDQYLAPISALYTQPNLQRKAIIQQHTGPAIDPSPFTPELQVEPDLIMLLVKELPALGAGGTRTAGSFSGDDRHSKAIEHLQQLNRASDLRLRPIPGLASDSGWLLASVPDVDADVLDSADGADTRAISVGHIAPRRMGGLNLRDIEVDNATWASPLVLPYELVIGRRLARRVVDRGSTRQIATLTAGGGIRGFWGTVHVSGKTAVQGLPGRWGFKNATVDGRHPEIVWFVAADFVETGRSAVRLAFTANHNNNWLGCVALHLPLGR